MATKQELEAAAAAQQREYEGAFDEDMRPKTQTEDEAFGLTPSADGGDSGDGEGDSAGAGAPAAVVIVAEPEGGEGGEGAASVAEHAKSAEEELNAQGAEEAKAATDAANAGASADAGAGSTATQEVGGQSAQAEASETPAEEAAESPAVEAQEQAAGIEKAPMTEQQLRSWEGRLRAAEAKLKASPAASGPAEPGEPAGESGDNKTAEALEAAAGQAETLAAAAGEAAEKVESGEMDPDEALKMLAEDFGEPFVRMIEAIARKVASGTAEKVAGDKAAEVGKSVEEVISGIKDLQEREHFEKIQDADPQWYEKTHSPEWEQWLAQQDDNAKQVAESGSARQIIKLIKDFDGHKKASNIPAGPSDSELDAAGAVSSGGLQLPEEPKGNDDFEGAWNDFA